MSKSSDLIDILGGHEESVRMRDSHGGVLFMNILHEDVISTFRYTAHHGVTKLAVLMSSNCKCFPAKTN